MIPRTENLQPIDSALSNLDAAGLPVLPDAARTAAANAQRAQRRFVRRVQFRRFLRLEQHAEALALLDPLPRPGESLHGCTGGRFSGWSLADAVLTLLAQPVEQLTISTLGFSRPNLDDLLAAIDGGRVQNVLLVVSDYFRHSDRNIFKDVKRELEARGQRVAVSRVHAKLLLFRTPSRAIVVETSANLRSSMNWEQFCVADDAGLLDFHRAWLEDVITVKEGLP